MKVLCLVVGFFLLRNAGCDSTFRFGAVLSTNGETATMAEAKRGYEFFIDTVNAQSNGSGIYLKGRSGTPGFFFRYAFHWREDNSDSETHSAQLTQLIEEDRVHFVGGSHPTYAAEETRLVNASGLLSYQCCVGPDEFYEKRYSTVFGVAASNRAYTKMTMRTLSLQNVSRIMIVYEASNAFTLTTCKAAIEYSEEADAVQASRNSSIVHHFHKDTVTMEFYENVAAEAKENAVDAVVACVFPDEGKHLVDAMHEIQHPLKAFYLTTGPTKQKWVDSFEPRFRADYLLSSAQWHSDMKYKDNIVGSTADYTEKYLQKYGGLAPTYLSAAASAVGLTLTQAIKNAFKSCDISRSEGDVDALLYDTSAIQCDDDLGERGYDRVLAALSLLNMETFFGGVKFNHNRRNVGLEPVTTQIFPISTPDGKIREIEAVLPLGYATELLQFPAENHYRESCMLGYFRGPDDFLPCLPCQPGECSHKPNADHCDSCPIGEWTNLTAQSGCFRCPEGTHTQIRGAESLRECICMPGYFNAAGEAGVECEPCPLGAECPGGTEMPIPLPGYWANETNRVEVYACHQAPFCKGGPQATCAAGHTGRLCVECEEGYFSALNECYKCIDSGLLAPLLLALLVGWYVINVIVSRSVTSLEMILGWAQLANIIGDINLNWTKNVSVTFGVANLLDFDVDILEPSCIVPWGFKQNCVTQLLLPFVMTTMAASGYVGSALVYFLIHSKRLKLDERQEKLLSVFVEVPESKEQLQKKWDATLAAFLAAVDVTYVTIAKYCFDVFRCDTIAGVSVLRESPEVLCGSADHKVLIVLASLGIAFYVVGYLAYISWKLYDLSRRRVFYEAVNLRRFGFVYEKFELEYYYTPAIIIVRKLVFVLVLVYMNNPAFQVGVLAVVINVSLMLQVYTAPYVDTYFDILFSFLLIALMFEAFGGMMFYSENLPNDNRRILEWLVIASLIMLTVVFVAILSMEIAKKFCMRYVKKLQKSFVKGSPTQQGGTIFQAARNAYRSLSIRLSITQSAQSIPRSELAEDDISFELLETFNPRFVYKSIRKDPKSIKQWNELTNMLKNFMSDQSETSYLSMNPVAKFWRKLVDRFPELVDFLAVADDETRDKFKDVVKSLYSDFYLTNKLTPLPLLKILNWRDYAPMAQWLAIAPPAHRSFFLRVVAGMFENNGNLEAADMLRSRMQNGGRDPFLDRRKSIGRWSERKHRILSSLSNGLGPFDHSAMRSGTEDPESLDAEFSGARHSLELFEEEDDDDDDEEFQPTEPATPALSEHSLPRLVKTGQTVTEGSSSDSPEEINVDSGAVEEKKSSRRHFSQQSSLVSTRSRSNKSVAFADET